MEPKHFSYDVEFCCSFKAVSCFENTVLFVPWEAELEEHRSLLAFISYRSPLRDRMLLCFSPKEPWQSTNWTYTLRSSQAHVPPMCTQRPLKSAGMTPALKVGLLPERHAELGCRAIINFYISIFRASYNGQNACAFHTWIHPRHVILRCVYTAEFSNSICSLLLTFFHMTFSHLVSRCWSPFGKWHFIVY